MFKKCLSGLRRWHAMGAVGLVAVPATIIGIDAWMKRITGTGLHDVLYVGLNFGGVMACALWTKWGEKGVPDQCR